MDEYALRIRAAAGPGVTDGQRAAALYLLEQVLEVSADYGVTLAHWDKTSVDLPRGCVEVICTRSF
ncbi:hypothetical protein ACGFWI_37880 [Streptomyces sp. NPDC048434]|uniref:hypothetical protein n=1 Tax=Streptomyces sp. NPDC048434 TaxID=3365549 RepID=UPI0037241722